MILVGVSGFGMILGMARAYRPVDREQEFLLPPSMIDWLPDDHVVWFVIAAVQEMDTSAFHRAVKLGGAGRRGYDPDMLLTLWLYAMAHGQRSSRAIERLCTSDVAFRVICAQDVPDHTVLARFRRNHDEALTGLLTESLVLAAELGMVSLGVVAFDGTKIAANASAEANRSEESLRRLAEEFVATAADTDAAEDALFGQENRGDETPAGMDRSNRAQRIQQALDLLAERRRQDERAEAARAERAQARAARAARAEAARTEQAREYEQASHSLRPRPGPVPAGADEVVVAWGRWQREYQRAQQRWEAKTAARVARPHRPGRPPVPPEQHHRVRHARAAYDNARARTDQADTDTQSQSQSQSDNEDQSESDGGGAGAGTGGAKKTCKAAGKERARWRANMTDPDSRLLSTRNGWIQGFNCETSASEDEFITSARVTQDANDLHQFEPTVAEILAIAAELARRTGRADLIVELLIGDAGYDSDANLAADGPDRLIADARRHTIAQRAATDPAIGDPPAGATPREAMNHRLRTEHGQSLYARRPHIIETPNAWIKDRRGLRQFARRGIAAAQAELSATCAVTNLLKLFTRGITANQLLTPTG